MTSAGHPTRLRDLAVLTILAALSAVATALAIVGSALFAGRAVHEGAGTYADPTYAHWSVAAWDFTQAFANLGFVAAWVTTSMWLYRARGNADAMNPSAHRSRAKGWAWAGWVTPVVLLWFPFQVVRDVLRASDPGRSVLALLGWWWGLWLATVFAFRASGELTRRALTEGGSATTVSVVAVTTAVLTLLALVQWALVMRAIVVPQRDVLRHGRRVEAGQL